MDSSVLDPAKLTTQMQQLETQTMGECEPTADELRQQLEQRRKEAEKDHASMAQGLSRVIASIPRQAMDPREIAKREAENAEKERRREINQRISRWESLLLVRGSRYAESRLNTFSVTDPKQSAVLDRLRDYSENVISRVRAGEGVILYGPKGTGKDHLAMALARAAIGSGLQVTWKNGMDLFGDIRDSMDKGDQERSMIAELTRPDVLYLSDPLPPIGPLTPFQASMVFRILDGRYNNRRPTWVTVNVSGSKELDERMGAQNGDRIRDGAMALFCDWPSYRKVRG